MRIEVFDLRQSAVNPARQSVDLPGTFSLGLAGLFCLAMTRGRKRWLRAFTALAKVGRDKMTRLPRVVLCTASRSGRAPVRGDFLDLTADAVFTGLYHTLTRYMGLLRRIASEDGDASGADRECVLRVNLNGGTENGSFPAAVSFAVCAVQRALRT